MPAIVRHFIAISSLIFFMAVAVQAKAQENSFLLEIETEAQSQEAEFNLQKKSFWPEFSFVTGYGEHDKLHDEMERGLVAYVNFDLNVFKGGADFQKFKAANLGKEALLIRLKQNKLKIAQQLFEIKVELSYLKELLEIEYAEVATYQKQMMVAQRRVQSGITTSADVLEIELARFETESHIQSLKTHIKNKEQELALLDDVGELKIAPIMNFDDTYAANELRLELKRSEHMVTQSLASLWPRVDVSASYGQITPQQIKNAKVDEYQLGVYLKWSLAGGDESWVNMVPARLKKVSDQLKVENELKKKSVEFSILKAELEETKRLLKIQEEVVEKTKKLEAATASEYRLGVKNGSDWIEATSKMISAKKKYQELKFSLAKLEAAATTF